MHEFTSKIDKNISHQKSSTEKLKAKNNGKNSYGVH